MTADTFRPPPSAGIRPPGDADDWFARGAALQDAGDVAGAETAWRNALELNPRHGDALARLIGLYQGQGRLGEALDACLSLDALWPTRLEALLLASDIARSTLRFDRLATVLERLEERLERPEALEDWRPLSSLLYRHLFMPLSDERWRALAARVDGALTAQAKARGGPFPHRPPPPSIPAVPRRLRIGYASANFGDHPIGHVTLSLFAAHDRGRFEVHGFSRHDRSREDVVYGARHPVGFDHFHQIGGMEPGRMAEAIHRMGIDILVEIDGHMDKRGLETLAFRPAPLQVYWLGHAGGLGMSFVDYLIADRVVIPPGEEAAHDERVVRLPDVYHCADRHPIAASAGTRRDWGLPEHGFVFCAFNNVEKITAPVFATWMDILRRVDGSVLWLSTSARARERMDNLHRMAAAHGVDPDRLIPAERVADKATHLARHRLADLFLDTAVINASTTALDALWAGLPVLTVPGERFSGRIAATMLEAVDMPDLVCGSVEEYAARAVALAADPEALAALKARLERSRMRAPLFDTRRFVRHLERGFIGMWARHVAGLAPSGFDVDAG